MQFVGYKIVNGWVLSTWLFEERFGLEQMREMAAAIYSDFYFPRASLKDEYKETFQPTLIVDDAIRHIRNSKEILKIEEAETISVRGMTKAFHCPIGVHFYNRQRFINAEIPAARLLGKASPINYKMILESEFGQYLNKRAKHVHFPKQ